MQKIKFYTCSFPISVDTCIGRCMTNTIDHFQTLVPNSRNNKGRIKVADCRSIEIKGRGTVTWKLDDDDVMVHKIKIKDTLYIPKLDCCLLSPQHVTQELEKELGIIYATQCGSNCALIMPGFKKSICKDGRSNVLTMHSDPG